MINAFQPIQIVRGFDPYDICCLILIVSYCMGSIEISPQNLIQILQLVPTENSDGVGLPTLENLVHYLLRNDYKDAAIELVDTMQFFTSFIHVQELIHQFKESIIASPAEHGIHSRFIKPLSKTSAICFLLPRVFLDPNADQAFVEDIHKISQSMEDFKSRYMRTESYSSFRMFLRGKSSIQEKLFPHSIQKEYVSDFLFGANAHDKDGNVPWLIVTPEKFRLVLDYQVTRMIKSPNSSTEEARDIIEATTLNDKSLFPDIILLEIILYRRNMNYQKTIDKIYQFFDYCRNSNISASSSSNFSHICQTFVLSSLYQDHGSPEVALRTLHELIDTIREKSGIQGLSNLWDILIHHLIVHPDESKNLQQSIFELLRPFNDRKTSSPQMLEYWYICQLTLNIHEQGDVPSIIELMTKVKIMSCNGFNNETNRVSKEIIGTAWKFLGYEDISKCLGSGTEALNTKLSNLESIKDLNEQGYFSESIELIEGMIQEAEENSDSISWKLRCTREKINIMLNAGNTARAHAILKEYIDKCRKTKNDHELSFALLCMARILNSWGQFKDSCEILNSHLHIMLQFLGPSSNVIRKLYDEAFVGLKDEKMNH